MHGPTTQCISKTCYQMLQLSAIVPNLCPQPKPSLISHLISTVCWILDQPSTVTSTHYHLVQNPLL